MFLITDLLLLGGVLSMPTEEHIAEFVSIASFMETKFFSLESDDLNMQDLRLHGEEDLAKREGMGRAVFDAPHPSHDCYIVS